LRILVRAVAAALVLVLAIPLLLSVLYARVDPPALPVLRREAAGEPVVQVWRPLEAFSPELVRAVIMAEDARFCLHWGIDLRQVRAAVGEALAGEPPRGASTITMQVVKNLFLWPERSYLRKAMEVPLAVWMDLVLSKDRIIEIYLNIAQWGPDAFGAEAAARRFFGTDAAAVSGDRALALATMLPAPAVRDPRSPDPRQRAVMAHVARELDRAPWVFTCLPRRIRP